ncbi:hypothetical protein E1A91_A05G416100v1 [Gossypium mustelinum]|uniref:Uncharacterized protein n=1 Tax=Gossypium mustelinum TaxID=34275 RepID=A0A5D2ZKA4_GOSMU|nr:hypothetical protein E1A91_A05G416100v1 [Gossypium mustelinum]
MADCVSMATGPCQRRTRPRRSVCRYCVCFFLIARKKLTTAITWLYSRMFQRKVQKFCFFHWLLLCCCRCFVSFL